MPKLGLLTISAGRKVSHQYCTRELGIVAVLELTPEEREHTEEHLRAATRHLQDLVDQELGDTHSQHSFAYHRPPAPTAPESGTAPGGDDPFAKE